MFQFLARIAYKMAVKFNVLKRGDKLFENQRSCDIVFVFDGGEHVKAHKILLAAYSDVFDEMLHGSAKELGYINIRDVSAATFKSFLEYFYFGRTRANLDGVNVAELLYLGEKYNVEQCVTDCVEFLLRILDVENAMTALYLAILYQQRNLMSRCEHLIYTYNERIFSSHAFQASSLIVLEHILSMAVHSCTEADLFKACMAWIQTKNGADAVLTMEMVEATVGDLVHKNICYGSMSVTELWNLHLNYDAVISVEDFFEISSHIFNGTTDNASRFNMGKRGTPLNNS